MTEATLGICSIQYFDHAGESGDAIQKLAVVNVSVLILSFACKISF